jgi:hypothetical protein
VNATKGAPARKSVAKSSPAKKSTAAKKKVASRKSPMSKSHKEALAQGRVEGRVIRNYLEIVEANRPRRGRKRTVESITKRLTAIKKELLTADTVAKLRLTQERMDLEKELKLKKSTADISKLEGQFVKVAKAYSDRNGITFTAWREIGVDPGVLKRAGITPND